MRGQGRVVDPLADALRQQRSQQRRDDAAAQMERFRSAAAQRVATTATAASAAVDAIDATGAAQAAAIRANDEQCVRDDIATSGGRFVAQHQRRNAHGSKVTVRAHRRGD
jgi:hypothetical protein